MDDGFAFLPLQKYVFQKHGAAILTKRHCAGFVSNFLAHSLDSYIGIQFEMAYHCIFADAAYILPLAWNLFPLRYKPQYDRLAVSFGMSLHFL